MVPTALVLLLAAAASNCEGRECSAACSPETGFCEGAGKCRCKPGWEGENCDRCVPFPGCMHGGCRSAWQCVCEEGWAGNLCDRDTRLCSSAPCAGNSTCVETEEGGYLCVCRHGYRGDQCQLETEACGPDSAPCQNGGRCSNSSCWCPPGFLGDFCEVQTDHCSSQPCQNGATCSDGGVNFACVCPPGFGGSTCNDSVDSCAAGPCANGGTCTPGPHGSFRCVCPLQFSGPTCSRHGRPKSRPRLGGVRPSDRSAALALPPQHYLVSAHSFHKLLRPLDREVLKVTLKETVQSHGVLVTHGQLVCFGMLALLTCLVVLGTTAIVFFGRIESWAANARYSRLLREASGARSDQAETSVNIILPERSRLAGFGKHYTSI
ncbi:protein delta homolog 1 [Synchiropus picturatus]